MEEVGFMLRGTMQASIPDYKGEYKRIIYQPGKVTRIILNRPRYNNAVSAPMFGEIESAFDRAAINPECHVIVISGAGRCFSAGHDAIGLTPESAPMMADGLTPEELMQKYGSEREVWNHYNGEHGYFISRMELDKLHRIPKPTIAMVHGWAIYGGYGLSSSMDIVFASEDALFIPDLQNASPVWDLGPRKFLELQYEHRFMTAQEAYDYRLVNRIYPDFETLEKETLAFANRVADYSLAENRRNKERFYHFLDLAGWTQGSRDRVGNRRDIEVSLGTTDAERHHQRYEGGRGMANTPTALRNLKLKLEAEGKELPKLAAEALARAAARDDKAVWDRALHQEWRSKERIAKAEAHAKTVAEIKAKEEAEREQKK